MKIIEQQIDGIHYKLREEVDFTFLNIFGEVFCVFDQNDSGNISFGVENKRGKKYFIKVAGARTVESVHTPNEAVNSLKQTVKIYEDLKHNSLIELVSTGSQDSLFYTVFNWSEGECLFDHWNFSKYKADPSIQTPIMKFKQLSIEKKLEVAQKILSFITYVEVKGYMAVDFYDSSLIYDFEKDILTICDIDLFKKKPAKNNLGLEYPGTKRMKAPEEYECDADIDSKTNVFTIGALFFHIFGNYSKSTIKRMYEENRLIHLEQKDWSLAPELHDVALKAVQYDRTERYHSVKDFKIAWQAEFEL